jgi:hypothetical protein
VLHLLSSSLSLFCFLPFFSLFIAALVSSISDFHFFIFNYSFFSFIFFSHRSGQERETGEGRRDLGGAATAQGSDGE